MTGPRWPDSSARRPTRALDDLKVRWLPVEDNDGETGIVAAHFTTPRGVCVID